MANKEACMCLENRKRGWLSSQITGNCVFCHIKFDARPVCDWLCPLPLVATVAQASDVVYIKASPPPSQGAINRGEKPRALSVMRLNQTSLSSQCFIELYFSFHSVFQYG